MAEVQRAARRGKGITGTMHKAIKQAKREQYENDIIHNLMAQLNGHRPSPSKKSTALAKPAKPSPTSSASGNNVLKAQSNPEEFPHLIDMIITRSTLMQGKGKDMTEDTLRISGKNSSNENSTDSSEYEAALKEENERIRQLCAVEEEKLARMEKQINEENKAQKLRLQMYKQKIDRLKKIVALEIFPQEELDLDSDYDICDNLSIQSRE